MRPTIRNGNWIRHIWEKFFRYFKKLQILAPLVKTTGLTLLLLWPWIVGALVFHIFLSTPQSIAIAEDPLPRISATILFLSIFSMICLSAWGCLLAIIAWMANADHVVAFSHRTCATIIVFSASFPAFNFVFATQSIVALAASTLCTFSLSVIAHVLLREMDDNKSSTVLRKISIHRIKYSLIVVLVATVPLLIGGIITQMNPLALTAIDPLSITFLGVSALTTLLGSILITLPQCFKFRWAGVFLLIFVASLSFFRPPDLELENPLLLNERRAASHTRDAECKKIPKTLLRAVGNKLAKKRYKIEDGHTVEPLSLVSAEGGGIRAAYWTAITLGKLDVVTDDSFGMSVASISGASGGSLGIATWMAARERYDLNSEQRMNLSKQYLKTNFLSPLLAGLFFLDLPRVVYGRLWLSTTRGQVFEKALADRWKEVGHTDYFYRPWASLCSFSPAEPPAIFFNATNAESGAFVPIGPSRIIYNDDAEKPTLSLRESTIGKASVAQAIHISARFPYLSSPAEVGFNAANFRRKARINALDARDPPLSDDMYDAAVADIDSEFEKLFNQSPFTRGITLVDGGYFDNSALTPTRIALDYIEQRKKRDEKRKTDRFSAYLETPVNVVHLSNDPGVLCQPLTDKWKSFLSASTKDFIDAAGLDIHCTHEVKSLENSLGASPFRWLSTPLESMLSARSAHSRMQVSQVEQQYVRMLPPRNIPWSSAGGVRRIDVSVELQDIAGQRTYDHMPLSRHDFVNGIQIARSQAQVAADANIISPDKLQEYIAEIDKYEKLIFELLEEAKCPATVLQRSVPLGWYLDEISSSSLDCLAARAILRNAAPLPPQIPLET